MLSATPLQKGLAGITALSGLTLLPKLVEELRYQQQIGDFTISLLENPYGHVKDKTHRLNGQAQVILISSVKSKKSSKPIIQKKSSKDLS